MNSLNGLNEQYYYYLPKELIAKYPVKKRDESKLLHYNMKQGKIIDSNFSSIINFLEEGDLLVANNTKVEARRVFLQREKKGREEPAILEVVFLEKGATPLEKIYLSTQDQPSTKKEVWKALIKKRKRLQDKETLISIVDSNYKFMVHKLEDGRVFLEEQFENSNDTLETEKNDFFEKIGQMPIPPYLNRYEEELDKTSYQSIFAEHSGSAAAPTASLHFSEKIKLDLQKKNIDLDFVTLHIGYGTFAPLTEENIINKNLHPETYSISSSLAQRLRDKEYNRLIVVGTTALRTIETVYRKTKGKFDKDLSGSTDLFLYPPDEIFMSDGLITNFHLPSSSLLMLVACMTGREEILDVYKHAVNEKYRFFSYGDAMLLLK